MNINLTYVVLGIIFLILFGIILFQDIRIKTLQIKYAAGQVQQQIQTNSIIEQQKASELLQKRIESIQRSYPLEFKKQQERARKIQEVPIINDCTGAIHWGSVRSAELANQWVDRN